jgi:hypothetical protein
MSGRGLRSRSSSGECGSVVEAQRVEVEVEEWFFLSQIEARGSSTVDAGDSLCKGEYGWAQGEGH